MGDTFRIVAFPNRDRTRKQQVLLDLADGVTYVPTRDTLQFNAPGKRPVLGARDRRYGGARQVGELHDNASVYREFLLKGAGSYDAALDACERIVAQTEDFDGKDVEFRPESASRSVFLELMGTASYSVKYTWAQFQQVMSWVGIFNFPIHPLARGDCMDLTEDWAQDSIGSGDYTFDADTAANVAVSGGQLVATSNLSAERRFVHTRRGYLFPDHQELRRFTVGATVSGFKLGAVLKRVDASNYIDCYVTDNGTSSTLHIDPVVAGTRLARGSTTLPTRLQTGTSYWLLASIEGNTVSVALFAGAQPQPSPFESAASQIGTTVTYVLAAGPTDPHVAAGSAGTSWLPVAADAALTGLWSRPYNYWSSLLAPDLISLSALPGSAPALADAEIATNGGPTPFALVGWSRRAAPFNRVWGGGFESGATPGWTLSTPLGLPGNAANSITADNALAPKFGNWYAKVVTNAAANTGVSFNIYRRFKKGRVYTVVAWLQLISSSAPGLALALSDAAGTDVGSTPPINPTGWQQFLTTWQPSSDYDVAAVSVVQRNAVASTWAIDGVMVYEGTVAPTGPQAEGRGGAPSYGVVQAEACDQADLSGWAITADASYLGGYGLKVATAGAGAAHASWYLDPSLVGADQFSHGELVVEVWARVELAASLVTPQLALSCLPEGGTAAGVERFSAEFGALGKTLVKPATLGGLGRPTRLGTLRLPVWDFGARWKLKVAASWGSGSSGTLGLDHLILVPASTRALSPSGKALDPSYPQFISSSAETVKTVASDLSARTQKVPLAATSDVGLGGSPIELGGMPASGQSSVDMDAILALWTRVPDDPTVDDSSIAATTPATFHVRVTPRYYVVRGV